MSIPHFIHPTNEFHTIIKGALGHTVEEGNGSVWQYVRFLDAVAYVSGAVCSWEDRDGFEVTADESAGTDKFAGCVAASKRADTQLVPTENQYGYIQKTGPHPAVNKIAGDDSISDGTPIMMGTTDGAAELTGDGTPTAAERLRLVGTANGASEDTATGTYNEDTVPVVLGEH